MAAPPGRDEKKSRESSGRVSTPTPVPASVSHGRVPCGRRRRRRPNNREQLHPVWTFYKARTKHPPSPPPPHRRRGETPAQGGGRCRGRRAGGHAPARQAALPGEDPPHAPGFAFRQGATGVDADGVADRTRVLLVVGLGNRKNKEREGEGVRFSLSPSRPPLFLSLRLSPLSSFSLTINFLVRRTRRLYLGTVVSRVTATRTDLAMRLETT